MIKSYFESTQGIIEFKNVQSVDIETFGVGAQKATIKTFSGELTLHGAEAEKFKYWFSFYLRTWNWLDDLKESLKMLLAFALLAWILFHISRG